MKRKSVTHLERVYGARRRNIVGQSYWARRYYTNPPNFAIMRTRRLVGSWVRRDPTEAARCAHESAALSLLSILRSDAASRLVPSEGTQAPANTAARTGRRHRSTRWPQAEQGGVLGTAKRCEQPQHCGQCDRSKDRCRPGADGDRPPGMAKCRPRHHRQCHTAYRIYGESAQCRRLRQPWHHRVEPEQAEPD